MDLWASKSYKGEPKHCWLGFIPKCMSLELPNSHKEVPFSFRFPLHMGIMITAKYIYSCIS